MIDLIPDRRINDSQTMVNIRKKKHCVYCGKPCRLLDTWRTLCSKKCSYAYAREKRLKKILDGK